MLDTLMCIMLACTPAAHPAGLPNLVVPRNIGFAGNLNAPEPWLRETCTTRVTVNGQPLYRLEPEEVVTIQVGSGTHLVELDTDKGACPAFRFSRLVQTRGENITIQMVRP